MRTIVLLVLMIGSQTECLLAQAHKQGINWVLGFAPVLTMDFGQTPPVVDTTEFLTGLTYGNSCISDTSGRLQVFTNGFYVFDQDAKVIPGGEKVNTPKGIKLFDYYSGDGFWHQMSLILPKKNNQYYVFTTGMSDGAFDDWKVTQTDFRFDVLTYHVVDMDANNGQGEVVEKNKILMQDAYLSHNRMSAVRHANGRDWWLVKPHRNEQKFYLFLVQPDTILGPVTRQVNFNMDSIPIQFGIYGVRGQLSFSPNGEWMASTEAGYGGVFVYHFDRCNGDLSKYHFYKQPWMDTTLEDFSTAHCFSPNNQLLYLINGANIWQYDLADTTANSAIHISGPDTVLSHFPRYSLSYLAPNEKIYIGAFHGIRKTMPFIEFPNIRGLGCGFRGRGNGAFSQPYTNLVVPPNMPHYTLGAAMGSACDTIKPAIAALPQLNPLVLPDAITANNDGRNDSWHILNLSALEQAGLEVSEVIVYNRWGQA
ncbi:MAG: hypothetical protein JNM44_04280, partial [Chitinophagaceae bacterium]|nr:hypothetical protein [Chitinophagaceae bacterium]